MAIDWNALYQANLGRAPEAAGLEYWEGQSNLGLSDADLKTAFFQGAAKEMQKDDTGLSAELDAWDENRIAEAMQLYDANPQMNAGGGYFSAAGDTGTTSAAQRLGGPSTPAFSMPAATPSFSMPAAAQNTPYQKNPYLDEMAAGITSQMNDNWTRNLAPSIRSGAMAAGGFGGSRQGVVEANGLNDMNRSLGQNLTNLYGQDYTNDRNRNLQQQGITNSYNLGVGQLQNQATSTANQYNLGVGQLRNQATSTSNQYDLGLRSNDLGFANLDANIANANFNNNLAGANFGLNAYTALNTSNSNGQNAATSVQNTPVDYYNNFSGTANSAGNGGTTSTTNMPGSPLTGALAGAQLYNAYNNAGGVQGSNPYGYNGTFNNPSAYVGGYP